MARNKILFTFLWHVLKITFDILWRGEKAAMDHLCDQVWPGVHSSWPQAHGDHLQVAVILDSLVSLVWLASWGPLVPLVCFFTRITGITSFFDPTSLITLVLSLFVPRLQVPLLWKCYVWTKAFPQGNLLYSWLFSSVSPPIRTPLKLSLHLWRRFGLIWSHICKIEMTIR